MPAEVDPGLLRRAVRPGRRAYLLALGGAVVLFFPDLGRQLLVRDDPSYPHALLVDVVGVLSAALVQVALVGAVAGASAAQWLPTGTRLVLSALRHRPLTLLAGLVAFGAVSGLITVPVSVAALGVRQVVGPLHDPSVAALVVAGLSDLVGTALTAAWFATLAVLLHNSPEGGCARGRG